MRNLRVRDVMRTKAAAGVATPPTGEPVPTLDADCPLIDAARKMLDDRIFLMLVVDGGAVVGSVSSTDLLRAVWAA